MLLSLLSLSLLLSLWSGDGGEGLRGEDTRTRANSFSAACAKLVRADRSWMEEFVAAAGAAGAAGGDAPDAFAFARDPGG